MSYEEFRKLVSELSNIPIAKIEKHSSFRDDLEIDSLQMVNLIVEITSKYGLEITKIQSNDDFKTVENMYQMLTRKV